MIRLGHIEYSNCVPVHALLLGEDAPPDVCVRSGVPTELNRALAAGEIDAAPCSSIEYARHAGEYDVLPFTIASRGPVQSILFECRRAPESLDGALVALPSASATSVVLLRILLERHWGVQPRFRPFEQASEDPFTAGADAALWIGDVALRRAASPGHACHDLGRVWLEWTGLPFAFALWQVRRELPTAERERLHELLRASRAWFLERADRLALEYSPRFGVPPARLLAYWSSLIYELDDDVLRGLSRFLALAAELGEAPAVERVRLVPDRGA